MWSGFTAELAELLCADMQKEGLHGRTLTLKLKNASFEVYSVGSSVSGSQSSFPDIIKLQGWGWHTCMSILVCPSIQWTLCIMGMPMPLIPLLPFMLMWWRLNNKVMKLFVCLLLQVKTRALTLQKYICSRDEIYQYGSKLLKAELPDSLRLMGMSHE